MWLFFFKKMKKKKWNKQESNHNNEQITNGYKISRWWGGGGSCRCCLGPVDREQQRQTWLSVSPFIHQHLKCCTKQLGSVCSVGTVLFIPLTTVVYKKYKSHLCVSAGFCKLQRGLVWLDEEGKSIFFYTLQKHILFSCCQWNKKCLLYRILGVGDCKKNNKTKQKKNQESEKTKKKVVVPNTTMQRRHLVGVQVFFFFLGKVDHRNNGRMEIRWIRSEGSDVSEKWQ